MALNSIPLFLYLEKENIAIDKSEFEFQIQSHSDYPSLLSISDTLNFFNIDTFAADIAFDEIDNFPNRFIANLSTELNTPQFYFIEKKEDHFFYSNDKKTIEISKIELEKYWTGIVLLIEKSENEEVIKANKSKFSWFLPFFCLGSFLVAIFQLEEDIQTKSFFLFPIIGILFSVAALKDLFGTKSELLNNFCNITTSSSCATILDSRKWKFFEIINFSDLSIVFFASQFVGLLISLLSRDVKTYFTIQQILLLITVPVLFLSIYYQKFVEKKWCPICLGIISIILLELGYLLVFQTIILELVIQPILIFCLVFSFIILIWSNLKKLLLHHKYLKEFQLEVTRFIRNYDVFKNSLLASDKTNYHELSSGNLVVGNENANLKITLISNPFCSHCKAAHILIEEILKKHKDNVCVDFRFNFNVEHGNDQFENVHQKLVSIYYDKGQEAFLKALHIWFKYKDENQLVVSEKSQITNFKINEILQEQYIMNQANNIPFTPTIIINQYMFPKQYDRKELRHFINDLIEDEF